MVDDNLKYPPNIQKQLGWLFFFLAWPAVSVGVNITFYIFLYVVYNINSISKFGNPILIKDFVDKTIILFIIWALFCSITQPSFQRSPGFFVDFKYNIQHVYWMLLFLFFKNNFQKIDLAIIGKHTFWGAILLVITFYFFHGKIGSGLVALTTKMGRNSFVYQIECVVPILLLYFFTQKVRVTFWVIFFFFFITLLTNGRAGTLILFLYLVIFLIINKVVNVKSLVIISGLSLILIFFGLLSSNNFSSSISASIRPYNERMANLLLQEGDGDLEMDKSWIERQIHIIKGLEVFAKYPIKGVGLNHFIFYDTDYSTLNLNDYQVNGNVLFNEASLEVLNQRSAHNSYIQILAETGFIGIFLYFLFLLPIVVFSINYVFKNSLSNLDLLLFGVIFISIHNWAISSYSSAITFALFGLGYGRYLQIRRNLN